MNFTRHRVAAAGFSLCLAACFATPASAAGQADAPPAAQPGPGGPGPEHGPHGFGGHGAGMPAPDMPFEGDPHDGLLRRLQRLDLSEAQQDKLFAILHAAVPERREHAKAIRKAHEALREVGRAERFDEARAKALSLELGQALAAEALLQARTEGKLLAILSPEQRGRLQRHRSPGPQVRPGWQQPRGEPGEPEHPSAAE